MSIGEDTICVWVALVNGKDMKGLKPAVWFNFDPYPGTILERPRLEALARTFSEPAQTWRREAGLKGFDSVGVLDKAPDLSRPPQCPFTLFGGGFPY